MPAIKHIVSAAIIILVIAAGVYFFLHHSGSTASMTCATQHTKIIAFGDSLVAGYGATKGNDFPSLLSTALGVPVQNEGRSGDTTEQALGRMQDVIAAKPDVVIVLLGGNDALQRVPATTTKQNLSNIIEQLQLAHVRIVLVGVLGGFPSDPYAPMFKELASQYKVAYVPNILSGLIGNNAYMSDEVHPNDAGYAKVAAKIAPAVESACAKQ